MALAGLSREFAVEAALSLGLQCLFLSDFIIDLLLEPTHLLLQLTNEIHHSLTDTAREKMERNIMKRRRTTTEEVYRWRPPPVCFLLLCNSRLLQVGINVCPTCPNSSHVKIFRSCVGQRLKGNVHSLLGPIQISLR